MNIEDVAQELASHLVLTRPLVCIDLEATGVMLGRDRIVQVATATILPNGLVSTWQTLVNPEMPIPAETTAVHGLTDAMVMSAPTFAQVAPTLMALLLGSDLAGYNVERFDRRLLGAEFRRAWGCPIPPWTRAVSTRISSSRGVSRAASMRPCASTASKSR